MMCSYIFRTCLILFIFIAANSFAATKKQYHRRPIIGLSGNYYEAKENHKFRHFVNESYVNAVVEAGGIPIIIPVTEDYAAIDRYLDIVDGLILTGGGDIDPKLYGEKPFPTLGPIKPNRDKFEEILVTKALEKGTPILGICRGIQIINILMKGKLYQDIPTMTDDSVKHNGPDHVKVHHNVEIKKGTWLNKVLGTTKKIVDSSHHQGVKDLGPGLICSASTKDGVIEALEGKYGSLLIGVQFHPEKMFRYDDSMLNLLKEFVKVSSLGSLRSRTNVQWASLVDNPPNTEMQQTIK